MKNLTEYEVNDHVLYCGSEKPLTGQFGYIYKVYEPGELHKDSPRTCVVMSDLLDGCVHAVDGELQMAPVYVVSFNCKRDNVEYRGLRAMTGYEFKYETHKLDEYPAKCYVDVVDDRLEFEGARELAACYCVESTLTEKPEWLSKPFGDFPLPSDETDLVRWRQDSAKGEVWFNTIAVNGRVYDEIGRGLCDSVNKTISGAVLVWAHRVQWDQERNPTWADLTALLVEHNPKYDKYTIKALKWDSKDGRRKGERRSGRATFSVRKADHPLRTSLKGARNDWHMYDNKFMHNFWLDERVSDEEFILRFMPEAESVQITWPEWNK